MPDRLQGSTWKEYYKNAWGRIQGHDNSWILTRGLFVIFALYLFSLAVYGDKSRFFILFFSAGLLSVWLERIDPHPEGSRNFRRLIFCTLMLFALINVTSVFGAMDLPGMEFSKRNNDSFYGIFIALTLGMGLRDRRSIHHLLWQVLVFFGGWSVFELFSRSTETFLVDGRFIGIRHMNPNSLGMGLVILFSVFLSYAFIPRDKRVIAVVLCGFAATIWLLLLTQARSSLLTAVFVTVPVALITQKNWLNFKRSLVVASLVFFLISPLLAFSWYSLADEGRKSPFTVIVRLHTYESSLDIATRQPWYRFYIGYGSIKGVNASLTEHFGVDSHQGHSHNIFLQTLIETGILGLMTLIFIFGIALHGVYREWKVDKQAGGDLSPVFITTIITILVVGQMDHVLQHESGKLAWIIVGLAMAYGKLGYQESALRKSAQGGQIAEIPTGAG